MKLDLHGYTVHDGWKKFNTFIFDNYFKGNQSVIVITGNGIMSNEIKTWANLNSCVKSCVKIGNNRGSWKILLYKHSRKKYKNMPTSNIVEMYKFLNR